MKSRRIQAFLIVVTILALAAGLTAGFLTARLPASPATYMYHELAHTPLVEELQLTPEQREQMKQIWEGVHGQAQIDFENAQALQKQRDLALENLLTTEQQRSEFAAISKHFADQYNQLTQRRDQAFEDAVQKTKSLLNETQQRKYDEILKAHVSTGESDKAGRGPTTR